MPSQRRIRALGLILLLALLLLYYFRTGASQTRASDFYKKTLAAMEARTREDQKMAGVAVGHAQAGEEKAERAKKGAGAEAVGGGAGGIGSGSGQEVLMGINGKGEGIQVPLGLGGDAGSVSVSVEGAGGASVAGGDDRRVTMSAESASKSVAGRKMMKDDGVAKVGNAGSQREESAALSEEEGQVEVELNAILKRSPIIIFSKSYCPHSRKAKTILLNHYDISPAPYVVELDQHALGAQLQAALAKSTGRRTVPNVLVNGKSIGGGDDMQALDESGTLIETVKKLGGKRIVDVRKVG